MPPNNRVEVEEDLPNDYSDGHRTAWPSAPYRVSNDANFRMLLAKMWFEERGQAAKSLNYSFTRLPTGYKFFEIDKPDKSGVIYKRLFGHPNQRFFDSTKVFFPHFKWLMGGGQGRCLCKLCDKGSNLVKRDVKPKPGVTVAPARVLEEVTDIPTARTRPRIEERPLADEEGTPDAYRTLLQKLHKIKRVHDQIKEPQSMDWRAERDLLPKFLSRIRLQHHFLPRAGELVLWTTELNGDIALNEETGQYQLFDFDKNEWLGQPQWMAGTVTQVPEEPCDFQDLVEHVSKKVALNVSGYRVEAFPDPNNDTNKNLSKYSKYVPLRQIRPLSFWHAYLRGQDEKAMHPSIKNALTVYSSLSLVEKFKFRGEWPAAEIFCKGVYIGSELLVVGDAVRIMPEDSNSDCTDVLVISSIRLQLNGMTSDNAYERRALAPISSIRIYGNAYTTVASKSYATDALDGQPLSSTELSTLLPVVGLSALGNWYRLHSASSRYEISYDRVAGRLYEPSATCLWLNSSVNSTPASTILSHDISAVRSGRAYSQQADARIPEDRAWLWADTRVQALALETVNDCEVGAYDDKVRDEQNLKQWRATLRVLDGNATEQDLVDSTVAPPSTGKKRGRKPGGKVVNGKVVYPGEDGYDEAKGEKLRSSQMVTAAFEDLSDESEDDDGTDNMQGLSLSGGQSAKEVAGLSKPARSSYGNDRASREFEELPVLPPHIERGGTEETDGGDYNPTLADFQSNRPEKRMKV